MKLLERERFLEELSSLYNYADSNEGKLVLILGEAGIGKTSLVEQFIQTKKDSTQIYWGACDDLITPRPLSPLYDIANLLDYDFSRLISKGNDLIAVFVNLIKRIQTDDKASILVIEDIHWADELSLDFIKYIGRRINKYNLLLIVTLRDDQLSREHPLKQILGDLPSTNIRRIKLPVLSENAVKEIVKNSGKYIKNLYSITGGNPFLVTELLNHNGEGIPVSIKESLLVKISKLSQPAKKLTEMAAIVPSKIEKSILLELEINGSSLDECIGAGILNISPDYVFFKHELARMAVEETLRFSTRKELNKKLVEILIRQNNPLFYSRIIHHAAAAEDNEIILKYAPSAAKESSLLGAHNQAAACYRLMLIYSGNKDPEFLLDTYEALSYECSLTGRIDEAVRSRLKAIEILLKRNDPLRLGENYRFFSHLMWYACQINKSEEYIEKAISVLEKLPPGKELAMSYSNKSQLYMLNERTELAVQWGQRAVLLARELCLPEIEAHALNNIGSAKMMAEDHSGESFLKESLSISLNNDLHDNASRAFVNLATVFLLRRDLDTAEKYFSEGIDYYSEKDLDTHSFMLGERARLKMYRGYWDDAVELSGTIFRYQNIPKVDKIMPLAVIGLIRARRGDPGVESALDEARTLAFKSGEILKMVFTTVARAEAWWLKNNLEKIIPELYSVYLELRERKCPWLLGEVVFWLWKGDKYIHVIDHIAEPWALIIKGEWTKASEKWKELRCPYERALMLSEGDEERKKLALTIFEYLGANGTANYFRKQMRASGIKNIPKGVRQSTKFNPGGLTSREYEILNLIAEGLSNISIANQLYISAKTVDHHISSILYKLNVRSRTEAAALVLQKNLIRK